MGGHERDNNGAAASTTTATTATTTTAKTTTTEDRSPTFPRAGMRRSRTCEELPWRAMVLCWWKDWLAFLNMLPRRNTTNKRRKEHVGFCASVKTKRHSEPQALMQNAEASKTEQGKVNQSRKTAGGKFRFVCFGADFRKGIARATLHTLGGEFPTETIRAEYPLGL